MHKTLLKAKEALEISLKEITDTNCPEKLSKSEVCMIIEIVEGIHNINKIIVDDSMRIKFYDELQCMRETKDIEDLMRMYDEFMLHREHEGHSYKPEHEKMRKGGEY